MWLMIGYLVGMIGTCTYKCFDVIRQDDELARYDGVGYSPESCLWQSWCIMAFAALWPLYWGGRALSATAEQLLLPPGDSV